ncbi:MAG: hypothetical protein KJ970_19255 [Candidatus Eisenbacteria bacterium]|uniref:P pilus assembly protein, chaperone PapD n=1 Tax=Eiseniibacteriota bacterium TaxID=2212470 RepID=A0A948S0Q0_UNCEI|nr:hypothetical protein [Candidatus Eisenbacteria bacterium]MBU1949723.1 hypothetical protein [Candidatus Eisenbacteria bacterium]MBU2693059.1 hypothetical protein [Candidatus Eisenbacteria bacterium]
MKTGLLRRTAGALSFAITWLPFLPLLAPGACSAAFVASPMEQHLNIAAGSQGVAAITVQNTGKLPLTLKLYLADSQVYPNGQEEDRDPGAVERSCALWTSISDQLVELEPGETQQAMLRMSVPANARGSYWTKLYIEEVSTPVPSTRQTEGRSYQVFLKQRVGIRIFQNVRGTEVQDAEVTFVGVSPAENGREIRTSVKNAGNSILRCNGRVELRDAQGEIVESLSFNSGGKFWVFPGNHRELVVTTDTKLTPGIYTALSIIDFGGDHLIAGEEMFRVEGEKGDLLLGQGTAGE